MRNCLAMIPLVLLMACGDDGMSTSDASVDMEPPARSCERDVAAIEARPDCDTDDDCPCGAHCSLGICEAECTADAECGDGRVCDSFGRCRGAGETSLVPAPVQVRTTGALTIARQAVTVGSDSRAGLLRFRVDGTDPTPVRVMGRDGAEVACEPDVWVEECELMAMPSDDEVEVAVRQGPDSPMDDVPVVRVRTEHDESTVTVVRPDQRPMMEPAGTHEPSGHYSGSGHVTMAGFTDSMAAPRERLDVPFEVDVWGAPDALTVRVADPLHMLTSAEAVIGSASLGDAVDGVRTGTATFPVHPYLEGRVAGEAFDSVTEIHEADLRFFERSGLLLVSFLQRIHGAGADLDNRWSLRLLTDGDAPAEPPAIPADVALTTDPELVTRTGWEAAFAEAFPDTPLLTGPERRQRAQWALGRPTHLAGCYGDVRDHDASRAYLGYWQDDPGEPTSFPLVANSPLIPRIATGAIAGREPLATYDVHRVHPATDPLPGAPAGPFEEHEAGEIPCGGAYTFRYSMIGYGRSVGASLDECDTLAARLGCTPRTLPDPLDQWFHINTTKTLTDGTVVANRVEQLEMRWTQTCVLPETYIPGCTSELVACSDITPGDTSASVGRSDFTTDVLDRSRDALCASGNRSGAIEIDHRADTSATRVSAADNAACAAEIARLVEAPPSTAGAVYGDALTALSADPSCVDVSRTMTAIGLGFDSLADTPDDQQSRTYAMRLLTRWLRAVAATASDAAQRASVEGVPTGRASPTEDLLRSLAAWDLLMHPRVLSGLAAVPADELASPNYRFYELGVVGRRGDEQNLGLSAVLLDGIARELELLNRVLEDAAFSGDPSALAHLGAYMPRMMTARALAVGLEARARAADPDYEWAGPYETASIRASSKLGESLARADIIREGRNPLGIDDDDLPLYFLDDSIGAGGRFAAVSDFLLGSGPGASAWAPTLVAQASSALDEARTAFIEQEDRDYLIARDERDHQRWVGEVRDEYNATLRDYCGPVTESLIDDPSFSATTCSLNRGAPGCNIDDFERFAAWTGEDFAGSLCFADESAGDDSAIFRNDPELAAVADACVSETGMMASLHVEPCSDDPSKPCLVCDAGGLEAPITPSALLPSSEAGSPEAVMAHNQAAKATCLARFPNWRQFPPQARTAIETPGCVRGTLGEAFLDIVAANRDVQAARAAYAEHLEAYDIAVRSCQLQAESNARLTELSNAHLANMRDLRAGQLAADITASVAGAAKDCADAGMAASGDALLSAGASLAFSLVSCGSAVVEATANGVSAGFGVGIENAIDAHESAVSTEEGNTAVAICYNDARSELVGMRSAAIAIDQATFDLERVTATLAQEIADADRVWADGHAYLNDIEDFPVRPPSGDLWADARLATFERRFRLARRASYLAVRAIEYEFQASLTARADVLAATTPDDLEAALTDLWTVSGTRTIGGSRPSDLHAVLSLRDDILRIEDEPGASHPLTPRERFRLALSGAEHAVYDDDGRYLGQQIPFTLAPLGALGVETRGVGIFGTSDCAERLWSVNASVVGESPYEGSDTTFVRLDLLKENTFSSQWCGTAPEGEPFQTASVRPARNLFREPGVGETVGMSFGVERNPSPYSRARMEAFIGVDRAALEDPMYANGESSELAARGLYGNYAVFIPGELIAEETSSGAYTSGLVLDRVDDILLRLDYISVAR